MMGSANDGDHPSVPRRGDLIELTIEDWGDRGKGIARYGRMIVLTDRGLPGERVAARVTKRRRRHLEADVESVLDPSPHRVDAPCRHFGQCGGCRLLDLAYERQLADKVRHMQEQIRRIGKRADLPAVETIPCRPPFHYRNKMEFSFGGCREDRVTLGLHPRDNYRDSFDLHECSLTDPRAAEIVRAVQSFFAGGPEQPHDPVVHTGFLRFLVVRFGYQTGDVLVNLVTADEPWERAADVGEYLRASCPYVTTALWTVNAGRANIAIGAEREVFFGPGTLRERLGPFEFEIAPAGFFQTNTRQAERLFARVVDWIAPDTDEVLDLYAGAGAISLFLSRRASRVIGVESYADSVDAAVENAARNGVNNCRFVCADVLEYLRDRVTSGSLPSTVVADPPRAGLHPKVVRSLKEAAPDRIVYVSCNTAALARDLELLGTRYRLSGLAAVDMFPHTPHIEAVALLTSSSE
ncbi:MAG: 23S rRNA (uracil(1939)-C(5))-methyltransferase RlmD [Candidatus Zixiibacteriota bacterium]